MAEEGGRIRQALGPGAAKKIHALAEQMHRYAQNLEFEEAARLRDEIRRMQEHNLGMLDRAVS
ncbi:MAG: hypothetical protein AMJ69_10885 [Gammaproteobacteria bacterium SG8_47]|nr:MAG: hypothetical protein AMJ69_10885 [Gammaproteobacteria bacterium SG8_47]